MDEVKQERIRTTEGFLTLLSGMRRELVLTPEDKIYNSALADVFDWFIVNEPDSLRPHTVRMGKWVRD